jgi:hypothetical protein
MLTLLTIIIIVLHLLAGTVTVAALLLTSRLPRTPYTTRTILSAIAVWPAVFVCWARRGRGRTLGVLSLHSAIVRGERAR